MPKTDEDILRFFPKTPGKALVELDQDHPGFRDAVYRERRNAIAKIALELDDDAAVPDAPYSDEEHAVWRAVWEKLGPLHQERASRRYLDAERALALPRDRVPQLAEVNRTLEQETGFRMLPVAGLVSARVFLEDLDRDIFRSTQYVRHHSRPLYTPEPDVIHELVGHAPTFMDPVFVRMSRAFGRAMVEANSDLVRLRIARAYWFTLEFGVVREDGALKAYGAGLLSSFGELGRFHEAELRTLTLDAAAETPFDPTDYQAVLFVAEEGLLALADEVDAWCAALSG